MKQIKDYPNYVITDEGQVINAKTGRVLKPDLNSCGYQRVTLCKNNKPKRFFVHRLVAEYFVPKPLKWHDQVNHKDGDKTNNHYENLEWCNQSLNQYHAHGHWIQKRFHKATDDQVKHICYYLQQGLPTSYILQQVEVTRWIVEDIKRKRTWLHISNRYTF